MDTSVEAYDVLILGGGPAGLSAALHLAQLRPDLLPRLLVLEKAHYPRLKLCAGALVADAEIILERLGLDVSEVPHVDAGAAHLDFAGRGLRVRRPRTHTLRIIRRDEFDAWLAGKSQSRGVQIRQDVTVRQVGPLGDGVLVETDRGTFRARAVIGADGSNGVTIRAVRAGQPVYTARVLEVITPEHTGHPPDVAYFDFFPVPSGIAGYTWDFPTQVNGQPMRCWGIYDTNILVDESRPPLRAPLRQEMARLGLDLDDYELKGHPIRWFDPFARFSAPGVLLAGDAAGADPVFGEGISMALGYGKLAAQETAEAFSRGDFRFAGYKRRLLLSPLGQTLLARWVIANVIYTFRWRWFQILLWRVMKPFVLLISWIFVLNWARRLK